jgi:hypothetical protein
MIKLYIFFSSKDGCSLMNKKATGFLLPVAHKGWFLGINEKSHGFWSLPVARLPI